MIRFKSGKDGITLENYNGFEDSPIERVNNSYRIQDNFPSRFFRLKDNNSYTPNKEAGYLKECKNNLIISDGLTVNLKNVENAFVYSETSKMGVVPITNFEEIIAIGDRLLQKSRGKIVYELPEPIIKRESLSPLSLEEIKREVSKAYNLSVIDVVPTNSKNNPCRAQILITSDGKKYILKGWDKKEGELDLVGRISEKMPAFFPRIIPQRGKGKKYGTLIGKNLYALEEFIDGIPLEGEYYLKGQTISEMHSELERVLNNNTDLMSRLNVTNRGVNESTLLSLYLDLSNSELHHLDILNQLDTIFFKKIPQRLRKTPKRATHGDINTSNTMLSRGKVKIIDLETLAISPRISDLVYPLIFTGNNQIGRYSEGSMTAILEGYNESADSPLSQTEIGLLPDLIKVSLIRSYVIWNIRRALKDKRYLAETNMLLNSIGAEKLK